MSLARTVGERSTRQIGAAYEASPFTNGYCNFHVDHNEDKTSFSKKNIPKAIESCSYTPIRNGSLARSLTVKAHFISAKYQKHTWCSPLTKWLSEQTDTTMNKFRCCVIIRRDVSVLSLECTLWVFGAISAFSTLRSSSIRNYPQHCSQSVQLPTCGRREYSVADNVDHVRNDTDDFLNLRNRYFVLKKHVSLRSLACTLATSKRIDSRRRRCSKGRMPAISKLSKES